MLELLFFGGVAYAIHQFAQHNELKELELQKKRAELNSLLPPKPAKPGWIAPKPPKPKTRADLVRDAEQLLAEELEFCKKLTDAVARQAAEASAYVRFRQRLMAIMEMTP